MPRGGVTTELVSVLFTDIVSSTEIASEVGDRRWRALVAAHHGLVRQSLKRHRGRELDTAGDGFFASFPRPADAIRCAVEVAEGVRQFGLEIRAGVHLGEAEVMGGKVGGLVVNTGARIMAIGTAGEVLVSSTVRDAVAGKGLGFADHGVHQLKGIEGEYQVSVVTTVDERTLEPPLDPSEAMRRRQLPPPIAQPRRRLALIAGAVVVAVLAGVGFALSWGGEDVTSAQDASPSAVTGPRQMTEADLDLVGLVPETYAETCVATEQVPNTATASVTCTDGEIEVRFDRFDNPDDLEHAFTVSTAGLQFGGISCRDDVTANSHYDVNGVARGSVACWTDEGIITFTPTIQWTDEALLVLGRATFEVATGYRGNAPDLSLFDWWSQVAGPTETGIVSPKDDPIDVPQGVFRVKITRAEVGPANEGGADPRWVGVWTISFDGPEFAESWRGPYDDLGSYLERSGLFWNRDDRVVLSRDYNFPPLGGVTTECERWESLRWELDGDVLVMSRPSPERPCQTFRDVATFKPWERVPQPTEP